MKRTLTGILGTALLAASLTAEASVTTVTLQASPSTFCQPNGVTMGSSNRFYVADGGGGNVVYELTLNGLATTLSSASLAGTANMTGSADGLNDSASFNEPWGIIYVPSRGGLVVSDQANQLIRFIDTDRTNGFVTTLAGQLDPDNGGGNADGRGTNAQFSYPSGLAADNAGNIYIADMGNGAIRVLATNNSVSTIISNLNQPSSVAWCPDDGALWVADPANNQVYRYTLQSGAWHQTHAIGSGSLKQPRGLLWVGGAAGLVVSDTGNKVLRSISTNSGTYRVTTFATNFSTPLGLARDNEGRIIVADAIVNTTTLKAAVFDSQPDPVMTPAAGTYNNAINALFTSTFAGNYTFHFTTNGATPLLSSAASNNIWIDGGTPTVVVRAFSPDALTSTAISNTYSFVVDPPAVTFASATASNDITVLVTDATTNCSFYYTLDGSEPTRLSAPVANGALTLTGTNAGLRVKAFKTGYTNSATVTNTFSFAAADPQVSVSGGTFSDSVAVTFTTATTNGIVYWTTNGTVPALTNGSSSAATTINTSCVLLARTFRAGYDPSAIVTNTYTLTADAPVINPASATNNNPVNVTLTSATAGTTIYWTADGSEPTGTGPNFVTNGGSILLATNGTLQAKAFRSGFTASATASGTFDLSVAPISLSNSPSSGTAINTNVIFISNATTNAIINVTMKAEDGSAKTTYLFTNSTPGTPFRLTNTDNELVSASASYLGLVTAQTETNTYEVQVDAPKI